MTILDAQRKTMDHRQRQLLDILDRNAWVTSTAVARELGCSVRTVKTCVSRLNASYPGIIETGRRGLHIGRRDARMQALNEDRNAAPQNAAERRSLMLRHLLMRHTSENLEDLAGYLCISSTTLEHELANLRLELSEYGLTLHMRAGYVMIAGDDRDQKRLIAKILSDETQGFFNQVEVVGSYFPDLDLVGLRCDIDETLNDLDGRRLYLNDYTLSNLILHMAITAERSRNGFTEQGEPLRSVEIPEEVTRFVDALCSRAEPRLGVRYSKADRYSFEVILFTRTEGKAVEGAEGMLEPQVVALVSLLMKRVEDAFALRLEGDDFFLRFGLHVGNLLKRMVSGIDLRNPQAQGIKTDYPFVYDVAVFMADIIADEYGMLPSEDEIAYLALHVGCAIEERRAEEAKVRAVLVCPAYADSDVLLAERISRTFNESLLLLGVANRFAELSSWPEADLIITTVTLTRPLEIPALQVSAFLGERDIQALRSRIDTIARGHKRQQMETSLHLLFKKELFAKGTGGESRNEVLRTMGTRLIELGFAPEGYVEGLFAREHMSSSAILDVAMPHPIGMDSLCTTVSVGLYPKGIDWAGQTVRIVLMIAVAPADKTLFRSIFDLVTDVLLVPGTTDAVASARSFDEFLQVLLDRM